MKLKKITAFICTLAIAFTVFILPASADVSGSIGNVVSHCNMDYTPSVEQLSGESLVNSWCTKNNLNRSDFGFIVVTNSYPGSDRQFFYLL